MLFGRHLQPAEPKAFAQLSWLAFKPWTSVCLKNANCRAGLMVQHVSLLGLWVTQWCSQTSVKAQVMFTATVLSGND